MGSFNVSCGLSSASIGYGERVGFIPLVPNKYSHRMDDCIIGAVSLYIPIAPPIYGTYDDYGKLENIEPNGSTAYMAKAYGMKPEQIFEREKEHYMPEGLTGMYFVPEVYEALWKNIDYPIHSREERTNEVKYALDDRISNPMSFRFPETHEVVKLRYNGDGTEELILKHWREWLVLFQFVDIMHSVNRAYLPPTLGEQCGDPTAEKIVGKFLTERAEKQLYEYEE